MSSVSHYPSVSIQVKKIRSKAWKPHLVYGGPEGGLTSSGFGLAALPLFPERVIELGLVNLGYRIACVNALPRKEVIQPQLPLRLPCYDFVPVTTPTLGRYLPPERGLAHGLQVLSAPMT